MEIKRVGVVGCGLMGSGITEVVARGGYPVVVREVNDEFLQRGLARIEKSLARGVSRNKLTEEDRDAAWGRITGTTDMGAFADCDLVIEAIIENLEEKKKTFAELDRLTPAHAILASNTSSLSVTDMAAMTGRPEQVLGVHFFNPVPVMPLVEMIRTFQTSDETYATARAFVEGLGKQVVVTKDRPGFIVNALLVPYILDAVRLVESGLATKEDIDKAVKLGLNHPMGPLTLLDFVGLDTTLFIADAIYEELKDPRYAAPPLLRRMVAAGYMGRKNGKGFYDYR